MATATAKLGVTLIMDNQTVTVFEGDVVKDLVYSAGNNQRTISGRVRVLHATTRANNTIPDDCPPEPYAQRFITVYAMSIDSSDVYDAAMTQIQITNIISIGSVNDSARRAEVNGTYYDTYADAIAAAKDGDTVIMGADEEVKTTMNTVAAGVTIDGNGRSISYVPAADAEGLANSGVFELANTNNVAFKDLTINAEGIKYGLNGYVSENTVLDGVTINGGGYACIQANGVTNLVVKDCILNPSESAYCNIEFGIGSGVSVVPTVIIDNVTHNNTLPLVYMDMTTVDRLKGLVPELAEAETTEVIDYVNEHYLKGATVDVPGVTYGTGV